MKKYRLKKEVLGHAAGTEISFENYNGKFSLYGDGRPVIVFDKYDIENLIASGWIEEVPERVELVNLPDKGVCKTDCSGFTNDEFSKMEAALNGELFNINELFAFAKLYEETQRAMPYGMGLMIEAVFEEWSKIRKP
jgi:hypothetical protein